MRRRSFLKSAALATVGASLLPSLAFATPKKKIPLGVQIYSVRDAAKNDLEGTLKGIAKIGYECVEFAGYYGKDPKDIRKMLDDCGLACCSTHTGLGEIRGDKFEKTVDIHKTLGAKLIIVPSMGDHTSVDGAKKIAEEFNAIAEKAKKWDMFIGYHAHGHDAQLIDGIPAWERFFDAVDEDIVHQMDIGNYQSGHQGTPGDPYKMIEKFKGRSKSVHLKEGGPNSPIIGSGTVDWKRTFELCETVGGTEWYIVEDEKGPNSLERIEKCFKAIQEMWA